MRHERKRITWKRMKKVNEKRMMASEMMYGAQEAWGKKHGRKRCNGEKKRYHRKEKTMKKKSHERKGEMKENGDAWKGILVDMRKGAQKKMFLEENESYGKISKSMEKQRRHEHNMRHDKKVAFRKKRHEVVTCYLW